MDVGSVLMPFDGYHYPVSTLSSFPNPEDALYRRGAPDTFDVEALKRDLHSIRYGAGSHVYVPGFDHAAGDPEANSHLFEREKHSVLVCEGLYVLHDEAGWEEVADFFDLTIFVDADLDLCVERLKERNKCIPGYSPEEIHIRCNAVD
jgi:pantothenate kinase